ncbi:hypothetical protein DTO96_101635 [Ephemeroptericola cinctiostellae]|uniref:GST N-terminal domain-containing protein n=1 Tax=Ephemeroptericola cinctiostellae TaxID=2268024 RepID=A0A345DC07_9BURK|nr:glutathione S-transferase [Ephemeroptericola cinctiostellae]AXF85895.1 hypothetical protein DTO96_101635 [Ephemeroptericola cinctiostellae]
MTPTAPKTIPTLAPVLYSFRRCPYAMRARLALAYAQQTTIIREITLKNKPHAMLTLSPKGTVPVLHLMDGGVLEESRDIMMWALHAHDPFGLLAGDVCEMHSLLDKNDGDFKFWLDRYKYPERFSAEKTRDTSFARQKAEVFLSELELRLSRQCYLFGEKITLADIGVMPFVRQFASVEPEWFKHAPYAAVRQWLNNGLASPVFTHIMEKFKPWQEGDAPVYLAFL